jgi:hypothetical protein
MPPSVTSRHAFYAVVGSLDHHSFYVIAPECGLHIEDVRFLRFFFIFYYFGGRGGTNSSLFFFSLIEQSIDLEGEKKKKKIKEKKSLHPGPHRIG